MLFFLFLEAPIKVKSTLEDKKAVENDEKCVFEIEMTKKIQPKDEIHWTFNGRKIDADIDSRRYEIQKDNKISRLVIKNVVLEDEGSYSVEINGSRSSANLVVDG